MTTLHIEHAITDFGTWKGAFDRFADAREKAGVTRHRIFQPLDDPKYVLIDLDFPATENAEEFLVFLHARVWSSGESAPGMAGPPQTRILDTVESR